MLTKVVTGSIACLRIRPSHRFDRGKQFVPPEPPLAAVSQRVISRVNINAQGWLASHASLSGSAHYLRFSQVHSNPSRTSCNSKFKGLRNPGFDNRSHFQTSDQLRLF